MLNIESFSNPILTKSNKLIKVRLWLYSFAFLHLIVVANWLISIDFSKASDPSLRSYHEMRWKLFTSWFNLLTIVYFPTCIYCDWRELKGEDHWKHVQLFNKARYLCFTSILLPATSFGDILFWRVWNKDRELIAPAAIDEMVPFWTQHCMHTVSLIVILLDLVLVPKERPKNMTLGLTMLTTFLTCYIVVCVLSYLNGQCVYPGIKLFTGIKFPILVAYVYTENFFYYTSQWLIVDIVWGNGVKKINLTTYSLCKETTVRKLVIDNFRTEQ